MENVRDNALQVKKLVWAGNECNAVHHYDTSCSPQLPHHTLFSLTIPLTTYCHDHHGFLSPMSLYPSMVPLVLFLGIYMVIL